ncbi:hypothetical protein NQ317_004236 [Molorchus minor]|uniref:Uncharacterized protein n=1 Tax=Molorchus minor TaxID=1323400 RepID=A0ABQ9JZU0_9CUCU|nr:hypothetical protein NQ317_004236 [Molorchus minor]
MVSVEKRSINTQSKPDFAVSMCTMNNCESEEIVEAANIAISNLLPTKSRSLYDISLQSVQKVVR